VILTAMKTILRNILMSLPFFCCPDSGIIVPTETEHVKYHARMRV
jgi:hypothetical protein